MTKLGLIGGGNMAEALVRGLLAARTLTKEQIRVSDPSADRRELLESNHGVQTTSSNTDLGAWAEVVLFAVKPQLIDAVLSQCADSLSPNCLVLSILAGTPLSTFENALAPKTAVVRAMPNTPALVQSGATALAPNEFCTDEHLTLAQSLFSAVGITVVLHESQIDAVTGLSGSGPAYVMLIIEALSDGGVQAGLPRDVATLLAAQTVMGAAKLVLDTGKHPGVLKDLVTSPGGTTIAGVNALEAGGLRHTLMQAVAAATARSRELGRS